MFNFAWLEMIGTSLLVAHFICQELIIFQIMNNGCLQMVHLMVTAGSSAHASRKICYNLAFQEVRQGEENDYQRIGMWLPILGNNKKTFHTLKKSCFQPPMLLQSSIIGLWILRVCLTLLLSHLRDCFIVIIKSCDKIIFCLVCYYLILNYSLLHLISRGCSLY